MLREPVRGIGVLAERRDLAVADLLVEAAGLDEVAAGVEAQLAEAALAGVALDLGHQPAAEALAARGGGDPHALDLAEAVPGAAQAGASDDGAVAVGHEQQAVGREEVV